MNPAQSLKRKRHEVEVQTNKELSIETNPTPENIVKCNQQSQSPLFKTIPAEIRNQIFSLALLQHEDPSQPYPEHDYCYRPGHRARRTVSTNLLLTCRRIWLEANHWPMEQAVHSFWFDSDRRPAWTARTDRSDESRLESFVRSLTSTQRSRIKHIQFSAQMYWLEMRLNNLPFWRHFNHIQHNCETFTITIRHSDWWNWESDHRLRLDRSWLHELLWSCRLRNVREFRLELETLEWRKDQLQPIRDGLRLTTEPGEGEASHWLLAEPFEETGWSGPKNLGGEDHGIYAQRERLDYLVVTMKWRRHTGVEDKIEQRWREEGSLLKLQDQSAVSRLLEVERDNNSDEDAWSEDDEHDGFEDEEEEDEEEGEDSEDDDSVDDEEYNDVVGDLTGYVV